MKLLEQSLLPVLIIYCVLALLYVFTAMGSVRGESIWSFIILLTPPLVYLAGFLGQKTIGLSSTTLAVITILFIILTPVFYLYYQKTSNPIGVEQLKKKDLQ
jgi:hypothetical protein